MAYEILMPQLGLTMEEGAVAQWIKHEGDAVRTGEVLVEITTDKLTHEIVSEHDGVLLQIAAQEGEDVPVKGLLGRIGQPGEAVDGAPAAKAPAEGPASARSLPAERVSTGGDHLRISPLARKTAAKLGVDAAGISGSGASGRITQRDVFAAVGPGGNVPEAAVPAAASAPETAHGSPLMEGDSVVKLSGMRKVVAERMLQAHTEIPPVTQSTKVDVTELMRFRKTLQAGTGTKYSVNDLILKAAAKTLRSHPEMLVSYGGGQVIQRAHVHLGMAVALDAGLIVPVIRDADRMGLDALSAAAGDLAARAKSGRLTPDEYKGSTFSVSNLGMYGIESFTPIINQPDAAILGVCAIQDELAMDEGGSVVRRQVMRLCLTYDHRLLDGAAAAVFMMDLRELLQAPMRIVL